MDLSDWQAYLHAHFLRLSEERSGSQSSAPVFALEHGLSGAQVEDLRDAIRAHIVRVRPSYQHWLPWVVYATESGYAYSGDEYWQTFEDATPGWAERATRSWLRSCFLRFASTFGGARPTGAWADHFTIISWPITHAILPKDLQRYLARTLFDVRHALRPEHLQDPTALGRLIHTRSRASSNRFRHLTEESVLIGQISAALLLHGSPDEETRILPATLDRIAEDLDEEQRAREWLRHAQAATSTRLKQRRLTPARRRPTASWPVDREEARDEMASLALEPHVLLLPDDPSWAVYLEVPDLAPLTSRFPQLTEVLSNSRCFVQGATGGRPMARGRVLSGSRNVRIESWPREGEVLLHFEGSSSELDSLLRTDCLLRPGPTWLFEDPTNGFGREIKSKRVRPGRQYIVASTDQLPRDAEWVEQRALEPSGIEAVSLSVPDSIGEDFIQFARDLGLTVSADIEVWPVGLAPASWDGVGRGEWLTTDTPRLGLRTEMEAEQIVLVLHTAEPVTLTLPRSAPGEPQFIELPSLDIGTYELSLTAEGVASGQDVDLGGFEVAIRDPYSWAPAAHESSPLFVVPDPRAPTLEELWDGGATFHVYAPSSYSIECRLSLFEARATEPFLETRLPGFTPPIEAGQWYTSLSAHLGQIKNSASVLDRTDRCSLEFWAEGLGTFHLECERASTPVRWVGREVDRQDYRLRVLDDRGSESELGLRYFSFDTPERPQALDVLTYGAPDGSYAANGLYAAEWEGGSQAVIVSRLRSLGDLGADPELYYGTRSKRRVRELLSHIELWRGADLRGDLSALTRRDSVVKALLASLVDAVGSPGWGPAERDLVQLHDTDAIARLEYAVTSNETHDLYGLLRGVCTKCDGDSRLLRRVSVAWLAAAFGSQSGQSDPKWLAEFALRLASAPRSVRRWAGSDFDLGLDELFGRPELLRAARFAVLVADRELTPQPLDPDILYTGWSWE